MKQEEEPIVATEEERSSLLVESPSLEQQRRHRQRRHQPQRQRYRYPSYQATLGDEAYQREELRIDRSGLYNNDVGDTKIHTQSCCHRHARTTRSYAALLLLCLVVAMLGIVAIWPNAQERELLDHYYGRSSMDYNVLTMLRLSYRIRSAQDVADTVRQTFLDNKGDITAVSVSSRSMPESATTERSNIVGGGVPTSPQQASYGLNSPPEGLPLASSEQQPPPEDAMTQQIPLHRMLKKRKQHRDDPDAGDENDNDDKHSSKNGEPHDGCETTIVLMRHCEKSTVTEHCAYQGFERSVYLASLFGDDATSRYPKPSYIFAEGPKRHRGHKMNFREDETIGPLAQQLHVPVDDSYGDDTVHVLSKRLMQSIRRGDMCGRVTVLVWKHSSMGHIARSFGCGPMQGCPVDYSGKSFDQIWQIKMVYRTWEHSHEKHTFTTDTSQLRPSWMIFGSVQYEGFDPLAISKQYGDYPPHGTKVGGRWEKDAMSYPERTHKKDRDGWIETRVKLPMEASTHNSAN